MTIKVENLTLAYGEKILFSNLSFEAHDGEVIVVEGKNGAEKSSLLRRIAAVFDDDLAGAGHVFIDGAESVEMETAARVNAVGIIFQNPETIGFSTTVEDEIAFALENLCVERDEIISRLNGVLESLGIERLKKEKITKLSRGERQLVQIAAVLALNPKIILADEPFSSLSAEKTALVTVAFNNFIDNGGIIIMVSHLDADMAFDRRVLL